MFGNIKKELLVNLIVSLVIVTFINPILNFAWEFLRNTYSGFIDEMYYNASFGMSNKLDFQTFAFIIILSIFSLTTFIFFAFGRFNSDIEMKKLYEMEDNKEAKLYVQKKIEIVRRKLSLVEKILTIISKPTVYVIIPLMYISSILVVLESYTDLALNSSFNRRMAALGPFITIDQEKMIKSKWAMMSSRYDFELINTHMENIAKKKRIKLPKNILD